MDPARPAPARRDGGDPEDAAGQSLSGLGNATLALYALDGLVSLADVSLGAALGTDALSGPRDFLAQLALLAVVFVWAALAASPRLPKRVFLPVVLVTAWWSLGAPPLPLVVGPSGPLDGIGVALQLVTAAAAFLTVRIGTGGWWLAPAHLAGHPASLGRTAAFVALHALVLPPAVAAAVALGVAARIERETAGFVTFHANEIRIHDRVYTREGREVRLVGMMHLGEPEAYEALFRSFDAPGTVVLQEGVSDDRGLLATRLSYAPVAEALGLAPQPDVGESLGRGGEGELRPEDGAELRNADVDASAFRPQTLVFLEAAGAVWAAPDLAAAIEAMRAFSERPDAQALLDAARADVLDLRNARLLAEIEATLPAAERIVVPWGALHLKEIEAALRARGFALQSASERPLVRYATLADALSRAGAPTPAAPAPDASPRPAMDPTMDPHRAPNAAPAPPPSE